MDPTDQDIYNLPIYETMKPSVIEEKSGNSLLMDTFGKCMIGLPLPKSNLDQFWYTRKSFWGCGIDTPILDKFFHISKNETNFSCLESKI